MPEPRTIQSLGFAQPNEAGLFSYEEAPIGDGQVQLETLFSGFSAGTELTFLKNTNPYLTARWDAERGLFIHGEGEASFPVQFVGYMESARVADSRAAGWKTGDIVGCNYGHKSGHVADARNEMLVKLPDGMDPILGIYVAQMGPIAANGILHADAELVGPDISSLGQGIAGQPVIVGGAGVVGLITALFAQRAGAAEVVITDPSAFRRSVAGKLGLHAMTEDEVCGYAKDHWHHGPSDRGAQVVFQTRAHSESLHTALRALRPQGSVIDLAFYQGGADGLRLGEEFHHNGLSIRCAQIGRVPRGLAFQWDKLRLAKETLSLLADRGREIREQMITHVVPVGDAPQFLKQLVRDRPEFLQIVFDYTQ
jgi:threonine dehydrogenase-like Zn-dependent dehydrogenase